jgi:Ca-activated chloride channel family protein
MMFVETLNSGLVPNTGTDFAPPLRLALNKLTEDNNESTQNKSKIIVLISDGEDFGEDTEDIVNDITDSDIRLFTLGVGTEKGSRIRQGRSFKTDRSGREVITQLDARVLKSLAIRTDGKYYEISDHNNDINRLINSISRIEGEIRDTRMMNVSANKYYYFLLAAFLLIIFDVMVSVKTIRI